MGQTLNKFLPLAFQTKYIIRVKTGDKKDAGTDADVTIRLIDENGETSPELKLDVKLRDDFERGNLDEFSIRDERLALGPLCKIKINRNDAGINTDWFVDHVEVEDRRTGASYVFPVHRWVKADRPLTIRHLDAVLPQFDKHREQRDAELAAKRKAYEYAQASWGLPVQIKKLPIDEQFSDDYMYDTNKMLSGVIKSLFLIKVVQGAGPFKSLKDIESLYGKTKAVEIPKGMTHWSVDAWFGAQRVMSCNPVLIRLCIELPEKFGVTAEMVKPFLEGFSLSDAMAAKKIYICDLKVMEGIEGDEGLKVCHPLALFFVNGCGDIMPIAIQLFQDKGPDNPVFLPSDDPNLWLLVKMWYNVADSGHHQVLTHLAYTHMKAEGIAVCTHRNLSPSHPMFKLLAPHFLHIMAINDKAVNHLLAPGGPIDQSIAIGSAGFFKLLAKSQGDFRLNLEGHLLNDLKDRGVDDTDALPFYPYRDDALITWNALWKYVEGIVALYYENDTQIQEDTELQQWVKELTASFEDGGIGLKGVPGNGKFQSKDELVETMTCIIFLCSAKHGAANFSQYDDYAFAANYPNHLNGDPPRNKDPKTEQQLIEALPTRQKTLAMIAIAKLLSRKGENGLGDFEVTYLYDHRAKAIAVKLREELLRGSKLIDQRNKTRKYPYDVLDPSFIPNSISI